MQNCFVAISNIITNFDRSCALTLSADMKRSTLVSRTQNFENGQKRYPEENILRLCYRPHSILDHVLILVYSLP